jgi:hypothetical protein
MKCCVDGYNINNLVLLILKGTFTFNLDCLFYNEGSI